MTAYAKAVLAGEILVGRLVRLACERHLRDLKRRDLVWDLAAAKRAIAYFRDVLQLSGGEFEGRPFALEAWQAFGVGSIFGWKGDDGYRRFRVWYEEVAKGNGKSPKAAGVGHLMLTADDEWRAEVYAAAAKKDQAMVTFRHAVAMRDQSPALRRRLRLSGSAGLEWNLAYVDTGSFFRPIASDDKQSGALVHCAIIDEIHEHKSPVVVDMMRAGTKGRRQALIFEITNSGFDRNSVCWHHHEYSVKVLEGTLQDDSWFAYITGLDCCAKHRAEGKDFPVEDCLDCDDWRDERVWVKANPNLGVSVTVKYLREQVREAIGIPTKANTVKRLSFNIWTDQEERWLQAEAWAACGSPVLARAEALRGRRCYGGLHVQLAEGDDLASFVLVFPPRPGEGVCAKHRDAGHVEAVAECLSCTPEPARVLAWFWASAETIRRRREEAKVPYEVWVERGRIERTPGNTVDNARIRRDLVELRDGAAFDIQEIAFRRQGGLQLATDLQDDGFELVEVSPTMSHDSPPMLELGEKAIPGGRLVHDGNEVLAHHVSNVAPRENADGDIRPDRQRSGGPIGGLEALLLAWGRAMVQSQGSDVDDATVHIS